MRLVAKSQVVCEFTDYLGADCRHCFNRQQGFQLKRVVLDNADAVSSWAAGDLCEDAEDPLLKGQEQEILFALALAG